MVLIRRTESTICHIFAQRQKEFSILTLQRKQIELVVMEIITSRLEISQD